MTNIGIMIRVILQIMMQHLHTHIYIHSSVSMFTQLSGSSIGIFVCGIPGSVYFSICSFVRLVVIVFLLMSHFYLKSSRVLKCANERDPYLKIKRERQKGERPYIV